MTVHYDSAEDVLAVSALGNCVQRRAWDLMDKTWARQITLRHARVVAEKCELTVVWCKRWMRSVVSKWVFGPFMHAAITGVRAAIL